MKKLSILIPTYNRPAKLSRLLYYLNRLALKDMIPEFIEVIVADGSSTELQARTCTLTSDYFLNPLYSLRLLTVPERSFVDRLKLLANSARGQYVLYTGDDDLPIFDNIEYSIERLDKYISLSAVAGRFINITGFGINKLCFSVAERPLSGFSLKNPSGLVRLGALVSLNSIGVSSLTYAIQRKETVIDYYDIVSREHIFHGGMEFVHQVYTTLKGDIYFENTPFIYRDVTYIGYIPDVDREAPNTDDFPYLGLSAINLAASMISESMNISYEEAYEIIVSLVETSGQLQEISHTVRAELEALPIPFVEATTYMAATAAWYTNLESCYPNEHVNLRRLIGSLPSSIRKRIYSVRSYMARAR